MATLRRATRKHRFISLSRGGMAAVLGLCAILLGSSGANAREQSFDAWLTDLRAEALSKGIRAQTLEAALKGVEPIERVIELDRRQPEFTMTFRDYMGRLVSADRIRKGREKLAEHREILNAVSKKYGVQPRFLVAFWGVETDFGRLADGYFPVIGALATLSYDERRAAFFRAQLLDALKILDQGHITPEKMKGSWAGAMGHFQFIPTTFTAHAVDFDGDGRRNIWQNTGDAMASAANFLSRSGWRGDETWGREVRLPVDFDYTLAGLGVRKPLTAWQTLGIRRVGGQDLPKADVTASVILPAGHRGPAFLVYNNFRTTLVWNRSNFYALAVGHLADRIAGMGSLSTLGPKGDKALSRDQSIELQHLLTAQGFDTGGADGVVGPNTRKALRAFQNHSGLIADGYPSLEMLKALRGAAGK